MTIPVQGGRTAGTARDVRAIVRVLAGSITLGFLVLTTGDPTPASVLSLGAGTVAYVLASFGFEAV